MTRPPRTRAARSLDRQVLARAFGFLGPTQAVLSFALLAFSMALFLGWRPGTPLPATRSAVSLLSTIVFASIVLMQMVNAFECRSTPRSAFGMRLLSNHVLPGAVAISLLLLVTFVYLPAVREILGQTPLRMRQWLLVRLGAFAISVRRGDSESYRATLRAQEGRGKAPTGSDLRATRRAAAKGERANFLQAHLSFGSPWGRTSR